MTPRSVVSPAALRDRKSAPRGRVKRELARRNDLGGIFPNRDALLLLGTALLAEQHDEWLAMGKRYLTQASRTRLLGGIPGTSLSDLLKEGMASSESPSTSSSGHSKARFQGTRIWSGHPIGNVGKEGTG